MFTDKTSRKRVAKLPPQPSLRVLALAEAGSRGRMLTAAETKEVCDALQAQTFSVRNNFAAAP